MESIARIYFLTLLILSLVACGVSELGDFVKDDFNGVWLGPSYGGSGAAYSTTYVTAFDYPDGYDWRLNQEKGSVRCSLVVFADKKPVLKVPVGDVYCVSDDPDMHRVIDGHLYTDYATDDRTIIKKDGKPYISYEGRESIVDMCVYKDSVYTLGQKRNEKGFSYRVNGRIVLERESGYPFGRLVCSTGDMSFAFAEPVSTSGEKTERYYYYAGGTVRQTALREDVRKVWDVWVHEGEVCYLASLTGVSEPVMVSNQGLKGLPVPYGTSVVSGRMFGVGDVMGAEMMLASESSLSSALWLDGRLYRSFASGMTVSSIWTGQEGVACALNAGSVSEEGLIFRMGETYRIPAGFVCLGSSPINVADGMLTAGLSSLVGDRPLLWEDGVTEELDVNGYICTVSSVVPY